MHLEATEHPLQHFQPAQTLSAWQGAAQLLRVSLKPAAGQTKHSHTQGWEAGPSSTAPSCKPEEQGTKGGTNHGGAICPCSCAPSQAPCGSGIPVLARVPLNLPLHLWQDLQERTLAQVSSHVTHKGGRGEPWLSPLSPLPGIPWLSAVLGCAQAQKSSSSNMQRNEAGSGDGPQRTRLLHKSPFHSLFAKNFNTKLNCGVAY